MVVLIEDRQHFGCNESRLGEDWKHMLLYNVQYLKGLGIFHEVILTVKFNCTYMKLSGVRKQNFQTGAFYEFVNMPFLK